MPELRQNFVTKQWVIIATERARRPHDFSMHRTHAQTHTRPEFQAGCPFCPGNEEQTPPDLLRWPPEGAWRLRVFPNSYPALQRRGPRMHRKEGTRRSLSGVGAHEVLVETPRHNTTTGLQSSEEIGLMLRGFLERGRELSGDPRIEQIFYFKNHGPKAGSSLEHPHCQMLAMPMVPLEQRTRIEEARRTFDDEGVCPMCKLLQEELVEGVRVIEKNDLFVALVPYAAFSPFHLWIVPRRHGPTFLDQNWAETAALARLMRSICGKLYHGLGDPDYNFNIRSAPMRDASSRYLHWYISMVPRVTQSAGFEIGSGMHINASLPEESAAFLRDQDPGEEQPAPFSWQELHRLPLIYPADIGGAEDTAVPGPAAGEKQSVL